MVARLGVVDDPHLGPAVARRVDRVADLLQLVLVDRDIERPRRIERASAEARDLLERAAAEPCQRPRRHDRLALLLARGLELYLDLGELARERLARGGRAVEHDAVVAAGDARRLDGDRRTGIDPQRAGRAVHRVDGVAVRRVREHRVIRPAELLDRRLVARQERTRLALDAGERETPAEPLVRAVAAAALDREAEQALALVLRDVEGQDDAGRAGVGLDGDVIRLPDRAHKGEPSRAARRAPR